MPSRLDEYDKLVMKNRIFKARTQGRRRLQRWTRPSTGVSPVPACGPAGFEWDYRKQRPYSGYDQFDFEIPTGSHGDCYDRIVVRVEEMRQSLRIIRQCLENMPPGSYKVAHIL